MYTVMKALNNNSVLVQDETGTSMIFLGNRRNRQYGLPLLLPAL